ncbi:PHP domain-containing protein [Thermocrinis sp.]
MIDLVLLFFSLVLLYFLMVFFLPIKWAKAQRMDLLPEKIPKLFVYSYQLHIHTQFSYDSLGKPEDVFLAMEKEGIDFALITDHERDDFKDFCNEKTFAGVERKIDSEKGILGDLLEIDNLKVIAHPFKEKYRWKLERDGYLLELIDLKDALLEDKKNLFFFLPAVAFLYPFSKEKSLDLLKKVINIEKYAIRYIKEGWNNPAVGGLDHHVKLYFIEVGKKLLFPSYAQSFYLMRNFLITDRQINSAKELLQAIPSGINLIAFHGKAFLVYEDLGKLRVLSPYEVLVVHVSEKGKSYYKGSNLHLPMMEGRNVYVGFLYSFKLGGLYLGIKPAFVFALPSPPELLPEDVKKTPSGMGV